MPSLLARVAKRAIELEVIMPSLFDILIVVGLLVFGIILGVILVRYGIRIGSRLTIAAQNGEPLDSPPVPGLLQESTK